MRFFFFSFFFPFFFSFIFRSCKYVDQRCIVYRYYKYSVLDARAWLVIFNFHFQYTNVTCKNLPLPCIHLVVATNEDKTVRVFDASKLGKGRAPGENKGELQLLSERYVWAVVIILVSRGTFCSGSSVGIDEPFCEAGVPGVGVGALTSSGLFSMYPAMMKPDIDQIASEHRYFTLTIDWGEYRYGNSG